MSDRRQPEADDVKPVVRRPGFPKPKPLRPVFSDPRLVQAPPSRPGKAAPNQEATTAWMSDFFRLRGWKTKVVQQQTLKSGLETTLEQQLGPSGPDNSTS